MDLAEPSNKKTNTTTNIHEESTDVMEDRFACNICFESVTSPVVTRCGHLYCWPCLYVWLEPGMNSSERQFLDSSYNTYAHGNQAFDAARRMCPVCKSTCSVKELVPIYVRECKVASAENSDEKQHEMAISSSADSVSNNHNSDNNINEDEDELDAAIGNGLLEGDENVALGGDGDTQVTVELDEIAERGDDMNISTGVATGLRRRRPQQQQQLTGTTTTQTSSDPVPARPPPPPSTVQPVRTNTTMAQDIQSMTIRPPIELHQSLFEALVTVQNRSHQSPMMNSYQTSSSERSIPSIHNRNANNNGDGTRNESSPDHERNQRRWEQQQQQDAATEFLSRLLLMLGCFVVLCLLLF